MGSKMESVRTVPMVLARGKRVIALSTDKEEQNRIIQKIKSGELN